MRWWPIAGLNAIRGDGVAAALIRSVVGSGLVRIIGILASFTVGIQLARGLGVTNYGYFSIALSLITLAGIPSEFGLPMLVAREVAAASARGETSELFAIVRWAERSCRTASLAIAVTIAIAALLLRGTFSNTLMEALLAGVIAIPLLTLAHVRAGIIQGLNRVVRAQIPDTLIRPLFFSGVLALAYLSHVSLSPQLAMAMFSLTAAVVLGFASVWLGRALPKGPTKSAPTRKRSIASAIPMGLTESVRIIQGEVSVVLAGLVAAPAVVGLLRIANVTAMTAAVPAAIMSQVGIPLMAKLHATNDHAGLQKTTSALAHAQFAGVLLLSIPLLAFPAPLLTLAFGAGFAEASGALKVLLVGQVLNAAFGPNIWLLNMTHHERRVLRALLIALGINLVAVPLLASRWGATGGAVALLVSMVSWNIISWRDARRLLGIETSIIHWPWARKAKRV